MGRPRIYSPEEALERERASKRKWQLENPEKNKALKYEWAKKNKAYRDAWRRGDPARNTRYQAAYRQKNREKVNAYARVYQKRTAIWAKRRAAEKEALPEWRNDFFIQEIYDLARLRTKILGKKFEVDHIVPLRSNQVCGLHCEANLRIVPLEINRSKRNKHWPEMDWTRPHS